MQYTAKFGDTWDTIAFKAYGDEMLFPEIIEANRGMGRILTFSGGEVVDIPERVIVENSIIASPFQDGATISIITAPW